jgi:Cytochrome c3
VAVLLAACRGAPEGPTLRETGPARFGHGVPAHAGMDCMGCHAGVPGKDDHAPCDGCHKQEFQQTPGRFCSVCHEKVVIGGKSPVVYPPAAADRALAAKFSHQLHADMGKMEEKVGHHVACRDCHKSVEADRDMAHPRHAECEGCHQRFSPRMSMCAGCHVDQEERRTRRLIVGDLRFKHSVHETDATGAAIPCASCHTNVRQAARTGGVDPPPIGACVACHGDRARTPGRVRMNQCEACHAQPETGFARLVAPRSHLGRAGRPDDHTLAFRRDHWAEAQRDPARCAGCHAGTSGGASTCDDCHQVFRPSDHTITWRELDHGSEASISSSRCATCHGGEYCSACHSARPRSHAMADFGRSGHAMAARANLQSCFTCHRIERECAACHARGFQP